MGLFHLKRRQPLPAPSKLSAPPTPVSARPGTRRRGGRRAVADGKIRAPGCWPSRPGWERSAGSEIDPRATAKAAETGTAGPSRVGARGPNWIRDRPGGWQHGLNKVVTSLASGHLAPRHFQKGGDLRRGFPPPCLSFVLTGGAEHGLGPGVLEDWPPG